MKTGIRLPASLLFAACFLIGSLATSLGIGVAVLKEQDYHSDATADPFIYSAMIDDGGALIGFTSKGRTFTVERKKVAGSITIPLSIPSSITKEEELRVVRRSLKDIQDFSTKFPKSAPVLASHIAALDKHIKQFESGKVRIDGIWLDKSKIPSPEFVQFGKQRYVGFKFKEFREGKLTFAHSNGFGAYPVEALTEAEIKWLENRIGDHRIGPVGFSKFSSEQNCYSLLIHPDYHFSQNVRLTGLDVDGMTLDTNGKEIKIPLSELPAIEDTMTNADRERTTGWKEKVVDHLFDQLEPKTRSQVLSVNPRQGDPLAKTILAKVFQVLPDAGGVLTDKSRIELAAGSRTVRDETYKSLGNPFTGKQEERVVDSQESTEELFETEVLGFSFIELPTVGLFEGKIVEFDHIKNSGTYQYIDVAGRPRTVPKYKGTIIREIQYNKEVGGSKGQTEAARKLLETEAKHWDSKYGGGMEGRKRALEALERALDAVARGYDPNLSPAEARARFGEIFARLAISGHRAACAAQ
ncbi:MAG: hypothetical protein WCK77_14950 [Verrucomicrobiota bacterium]